MKVSLIYDDGSGASDVQLVVSKYSYWNDNILVGLVNYEDCIDITVNVHGLSHTPYQAVINTCGQKESITDFLEKNDLAKPTGEVADVGYYKCPVYEFNKDILQIYDPKGVEGYEEFLSCSSYDFKRYQNDSDHDRKVLLCRNTFHEYQKLISECRVNGANFAISHAYSLCLARRIHYELDSDFTLPSYVTPLLTFEKPLDTLIQYHMFKSERAYDSSYQNIARSIRLAACARHRECCTKLPKGDSFSQQQIYKMLFKRELKKADSVLFDFDSDENRIFHLERNINQELSTIKDSPEKASYDISVEFYEIFANQILASLKSHLIFLAPLLTFNNPLERLLAYHVTNNSDKFDLSFENVSRTLEHVALTRYNQIMKYDFLPKKEKMTPDQIRLYRKVISEEGYLTG